MPKPKSNRKRKLPARLGDEDILLDTQTTVESDELSQHAEQTETSLLNVEVASSINKNPDRPVMEGEGITKQNVQTTMKVRKNNTGLGFRMLRRTIYSLASKVSDLAKELDNSKQTNHKETLNQEKDNGINVGVENNKQNENQIIELPIQEVNSQTPTQDKTSGGDFDHRQIIYNIRNINMERPKFEGLTGSHPVTFLEELEAYLRKSVKEGQNEVELILECLQGDARDFARVYCKRWKNLNDFKRDFLSTYWGDKEQNELRRKIVYGTWDRQYSPSMLNYFLRITGKAQMLTHQIPENQMVSDIIRHFRDMCNKYGFHYKKGQ
ncbi:hypothetical protein NE865_08548 [Phthorimaea operculella]|nr:hypothetical protein NE865_08548 [Phthorimaea operculella]